MKHVTIIGAGSFGTALATVLDTAGNKVHIWAREPEIVESINKEHKNHSYLPDLNLPEGLEAYNDIEKCLNNQDIVLFAVPSHTLRDVAAKIKPCLSGNEILVTVSKGIENESFKTMSQVLMEVMD